METQTVLSQQFYVDSDMLTGNILSSFVLGSVNPFGERNRIYIRSKVAICYNTPVAFSHLSPFSDNVALSISAFVVILICAV